MAAARARVTAAAAQESLPLAGEWRFQLDQQREGIEKVWFGQQLTGKIRLPGSTDEGGYGRRYDREPDFDGLTRNFEFVGAAWYQRDVEIPREWAGKRVTLFLERCHWETRAWLDDHAAGMRDSLCVPHIYDLGAVSPGRHRLTVRVDNSLKYNMGKDAHSTSEQTQSNWNGMIGRLELRATDPVWIEDVQVYPDVDRRLAKVRVVVGNAISETAQGRLELQFPGRRGVLVGFTAAEHRTTMEVELPMPSTAGLWNEFSPSLHELNVMLAARSGRGVFSDRRRVSFGMRRFSATGDRHFALNGRKIYLRGTLDCCIFPRTGYPPTDTASWLRICRIARAHGLNHLRFHSWCPPEAAFAAADQSGFILHVEAPQWAFDVGKDPPRDRFIREELDRILDAYGNHPSFCMMVLGNELAGDFNFLEDLVKHGQGKDPRRLYSCATARKNMPADEFYVSHRTLKGGVRGIQAGPSTGHDFGAFLTDMRVPFVSHEIGEWAVYPKLDEIGKYTGVLRARNFEKVRDDLARKGMLDQARDFTRASGKLAALLYKEEVEVLRRTPGHAGFQLLDLHDFPGQGTALVGILDAFWDSKGLIRPEEFRRFCGPTVPLLRMRKRTFTADETLEARAEIAHFGSADIADAVVRWAIRDGGSREIAAGAFARRTLPVGGPAPLGEIRASLAAAEAPVRLTVTIWLDGTEIRNDWEIWVYPSEVSVPVPPGVTVTRRWDATARATLASGGKLLLLAGPDILVDSLPGSFKPVFWSPIWFKSQPDTMGILCRPDHPALAAFPTEMHADWQWYDLLEHSRTVILNELPAGVRPIVQVIDNFSRNHRLGNLLEARTGGGKLVVCTLDIWSDLEHRPEARQLLRGILAYMDSDVFQPAHEWNDRQLGGLLKEAS
jgi:hypothetical protein